MTIELDREEVQQANAYVNTAFLLFLRLQVKNFVISILVYHLVPYRGKQSRGRFSSENSHQNLVTSEKLVTFPD